MKLYSSEHPGGSDRAAKGHFPKLGGYKDLIGLELEEEASGDNDLAITGDRFPGRNGFLMQRRAKQCQMFI